MYAITLQKESPLQASNLLQWDQKQKGFYEVYYLKFNFPQGALWLRFTLLSSWNGLKQVAETWAIAFLQDNDQTKKIAVKNTFPLNQLVQNSEGTLCIAEKCTFADHYTTGSISSQGQTIEWDLKYTENDYTFFHVPEVLKKLKLTKSTVCKPNTNISFNGTITVNGTSIACSSAPGCQGHIWGSRYPHSWAWAHCNAFEGNSDTTLEILTARVKPGGLFVSPAMTAVFFDYEGKKYLANTLLKVLQIKSAYTLSEWSFSAHLSQDLFIEGKINCSIKDFIGVTYEDPQGSYLYCYNSELASLELNVFRNRSLVETLRAPFKTAYETVSRERSPYVNLLL